MHNGHWKKSPHQPEPKFNLGEEMKVLITLCALFCFASDAGANSSGSVAYETHTVTTWGAVTSGSSHGEMRRGQQRRANRKAKRAASSCHGTLSYAAPVVSYAAPVAAEVTCEACAPVAAIAAPVYVASAPVYVPVVRARIWRRPVAVVAAPLCLTGQCPTQ